MKQPPTPKQLAMWQSMIGERIWKKSRKPFKSKLQVNTVTGITTHPYRDSPCFTFKEDDSFVECIKCERKFV